jgi:hypothetical protein
MMANETHVPKLHTDIVRHKQENGWFHAIEWNDSDSFPELNIRDIRDTRRKLDLGQCHNCDTKEAPCGTVSPHQSARRGRKVDK